MRWYGLQLLMSLNSEFSFAKTGAERWTMSSVAAAHIGWPQTCIYINRNILPPQSCQAASPRERNSQVLPPKPRHSAFISALPIYASHFKSYSQKDFSILQYPSIFREQFQLLTKSTWSDFQLLITKVHISIFYSIYFMSKKIFIIGNYIFYFIIFITKEH